MDIVSEIAIRLKDRMIVLDKDLCERKIDVSKKSEMYTIFHQLKGKHYKNLKQGPGWSFPLTAFTSNTEKDTTTLKKYDIDIPKEVYQYFHEYEKLLFS